MKKYLLSIKIKSIILKEIAKMSFEDEEILDMVHNRNLETILIAAE